MGQTPMPQAGGGGALLQLLARPEVINAILSLAMGQMGRNQIQVGQQMVPAQRLAGLATGGSSPAGYDEAFTEGDAFGDEAVVAALYNSPAQDHPFEQTLRGEAGHTYADDLFSHDSDEASDLFVEYSGRQDDEDDWPKDDYEDDLEDDWDDDDNWDGASFHHEAHPHWEPAQ